MLGTNYFEDKSGMPAQGEQSMMPSGSSLDRCGWRAAYHKSDHDDEAEQVPHGRGRLNRHATPGGLSTPGQRNVTLRSSAGYGTPEASGRAIDGCLRRLHAQEIHMLASHEGDGGLAPGGGGQSCGIAMHNHC